ncbi:alkaline shock response membrane anchor protein AmaP [Pseudonocardia kujensis]|uniref:alkaline shock response membrane anchor protein AmaP n=1 Tax=Pseudonocardia kujensis TaxID=1128675 RepID=UPI001E499266|nr:alkaline shock response membrane anchor protein AmaP [Pseudonocardia kujensis]MCE0766077.1 alkaline shock response membrane anchor protein AmaP [Pseudonocardia kujensis]
MSTTDVQADAPTTGTAAPPRRVLRGSRRAVARSARVDRIWLALLGFVLLAAGTLAALLGYGVFGAGRAARPLLDPLIVDALRAQQQLWRWVAIAVGVVLVVLGLWWAVRSLRPERRPDLLLDGSTDSTLLVTAGAVAGAVGDRAAALPGVGRARARMVGSTGTPALRLTVWVTDEADVADVCRRLETEVVAEARRALGLAHLPVAVRLELDSVTQAPRVA